MAKYHPRTYNHFGHVSQQPKLTTEDAPGIHRQVEARQFHKNLIEAYARRQRYVEDLENSMHLSIE